MHLALDSPKKKVIEYQKNKHRIIIIYVIDYKMQNSVEPNEKEV